jgi:hypothetical protein
VKKLDPTYRLYTVSVTTDCLVYASSADVACSIAKEQYLQDDPAWSVTAKLSRVTSATPGHDARYSTLGWFDDTPVYTDLTSANHQVTVAEAVSLDRKTCEVALQQQGGPYTYIAECYLRSGEQVDRIIHADTIFEAAQLAMQLSNVANVRYVRLASTPQR